jgi:predicted nucleic acid-binding Zn ribbon protein
VDPHRHCNAAPAAINAGGRFDARIGESGYGR